MTVDSIPLLGRVAALIPKMQERAAALDETGTFPTDDIADLRRCGALAAPVPTASGGLGLGTEAAGASASLALLRILGRGNLAVGRVFEAHVNALRLVFRYGDEPLRRRAAADAAHGRLIGLWVTDPAEGGLRLLGSDVVDGAKQFCSGAGHVTHAVVTVTDGSGDTRLAYVANGAGFSAAPLPGSLAGMRAARTGQVRYDQVAGTVFGQPGDYLREPDFSCGAWRTSAVTAGAVEALTDLLCAQLVARRRGGDPHQQARVGQAMLATETARLWMAEAARRAEAATEADADDAVAYVGLARLAVDRAAREVMDLVRRSLGVAAAMRDNPVERVCRDLTTYLCQPAADMVLTEAAARMLAA